MRLAQRQQQREWDSSDWRHLIIRCLSCCPTDCSITDCTMADEPFANPIAPDHNVQPAHRPPAAPQVRHPLTNEDFRKLIATPRVGSSSATPSLSRSRVASSRSKRPHHARSQKQVLSQDSSDRRKESRDEESDGKKELRKQKEPDVLSELAQRYRDRAKERRDGANPDYVSNDELMMTSNGAYVAPDLQSRSDFAERRKQLIEESKFLGGDMEHTHLVKGLDYALLHKVKAELQQTEQDEEAEEEDDEDGVDFLEEGKKEIDGKKKRPQAHKSDVSGDEFDVRSRLAVSIVKLLNQKSADRSELFLPFRMAYLVDLESEAPDDIPVTVIRSKSECPALGAVFSHTTSDIVINKLASIIHNHRTGRLKGAALSVEKQEKGVKVEEDRSVDSRKTRRASETTSKSVVSIYDDLVDDYEPPRVRKKSTPQN